MQISLPSAKPFLKGFTGKDPSLGCCANYTIHLDDNAVGLSPPFPAWDHWSACCLFNRHI